MATTRVTQLL